MFACSADSGDHNSGKKKSKMASNSNTKTIHNTYSHKQIYRHKSITGFDHLLTIIRPIKYAVHKIQNTRNYTNTLLHLLVTEYLYDRSTFKTVEDTFDVRITPKTSPKF